MLNHFTPDLYFLYYATLYFLYCAKSLLNYLKQVYYLSKCCTNSILFQEFQDKTKQQ